MNTILDQQPTKSDMDTWKMFICAGNNCFKDKQSLTAITYYQKAIRLSERLFNKEHDIQSAVTTMVVSHHNLADLFIQEGNAKLAENELRTVHQKLSFSLKEAIPNSLKVEALLWGVSRTYFALISHIKNHPSKVMSVPVTTPTPFEAAFKNNLN